MRVIAATLKIHKHLEIYFRNVRLDVLPELNLDNIAYTLSSVRSEQTDAPKAHFSSPSKFGISLLLFKSTF